MSESITKTVLLEPSEHRVVAPRIFQEYIEEKPLEPTMKSTPVECSTTLDARLWINEHHFIVTDSAGQVVNKLPHTPDDYWDTQEQTPRHLDGTTLVLGAFGDFQYYHWLLDALPKIGLLENAGISIDSIDNVVFREVSTDFHRETLNIAGIPDEKIVESVSNPRFTCDKVLDVRMSNFVGMTMPRFVPEYIRRIVMAAEAQSVETHERIYIGRPRSLKRRGVANEEDLVALLSDYGFVHLEMENYSVRQQAHLFNSAKVVMTPHGGALANLVFCQPGTKVLELFANHVFSYFYGLANLCELDYTAVLRSAEQYSRVVDPWAGNSMTDQHVTSKEQSIPVSLENIESALTGNGFSKNEQSTTVTRAA